MDIIIINTDVVLFLFYYVLVTVIQTDRCYSIPSISVLVTTVIALLARSFRLKEVLSWSTDTIREPECFRFPSTSVVCGQEWYKVEKHKEQS